MISNEGPGKIPPSWDVISFSARISEVPYIMYLKHHLFSIAIAFSSLDTLKVQHI